jgi:hypothetical protein
MLGPLLCEIDSARRARKYAIHQQYNVLGYGVWSIQCYLRSPFHPPNDGQSISSLPPHLRALTREKASRKFDICVIEMYLAPLGVTRSGE